MDIKEVSEIFYNFAIGGGLFGGTKAVASWFASNAKKKYVNEIKKNYPRSQLNNTFKLVDHEKAPGVIYLADLNKNEKYWIQSSRTYLELDFFWHDFRRITAEEFNSYKEGPPILTSGTPGS